VADNHLNAHVNANVSDDIAALFENIKQWSPGLFLL
jgi:hypothetical protein